MNMGTRTIKSHGINRESRVFYLCSRFISSAAWQSKPKSTLMDLIEFNVCRFQNGEFQAYTNDKANTYVKDGTLFIKPVSNIYLHVPINARCIIYMYVHICDRPFEYKSFSLSRFTHFVHFQTLTKNNTNPLTGQKFGEAFLHNGKWNLTSKCDIITRIKWYSHIPFVWSEYMHGSFESIPLDP